MTSPWSNGKDPLCDPAYKWLSVRQSQCWGIMLDLLLSAWPEMGGRVTWVMLERYLYGRRVGWEQDARVSRFLV